MIKKKLIHNGRVVLSNMVYATSTWDISRGLMFKGRETVNKGICLVMPSKKNVRFGCSVTMLFCFVDMEILFVDSNFKVVDKKRLKTWTPSYTPKAPCKYVVESVFGKFKDIRVGDLISIE